MRKFLPFLFAVVFLYSSCSKQNTPAPVKSSFKITVKPSLAYAVNSNWQQVLGGEAIITFTPVNKDTLSVLTDSLNLSNVSNYSRQVFSGTYNIGLNTESKAVADIFIRFKSVVNNISIITDQAVTFPATTNDGVITINKTLLDTTVTPTFVPAGSASAVQFGKANGYYFIYVTGNTTGRVSFVEGTTGYTYLQDLTVSAMNQYDLSPIINKTDVIIHKHLFQLNTNLVQGL